MPRPMPAFMKPKIRCKSCGRNLEKQLGYTYIPYARWECTYCGTANYIIPFERLNDVKDPDQAYDDDAADESIDLVAGAAQGAQKFGAAAGELGVKGWNGLRAILASKWKTLDTKKKLIVTGFCIFFFIFLILAIRSQGLIEVRYSYNQLVGQDYADAERMLRGAGFRNIKTKELCDLGSEEQYKLNQVAMVMIGEESVFTADDQFYEDSDVVIYYHCPVMVKVPVSPGELPNYSSDEVFYLFQRAGFRDVEMVKYQSLGADPGRYNIKSVSVGGSEDFQEGDSFDWNQEVVITYYAILLKVPVSSLALQSMSLDECINAFRQAGFVDITTQEVEAFDQSYGKANLCFVSVAGKTEFEEGLYVDRDTPVIIAHYPSLSE